MSCHLSQLFSNSSSRTLFSNLQISFISNHTTFPVELAFTPKTRLAPFSLPIEVDSYGNKYALFYVNGSGQSIEVKLLSDCEIFAAVVLGSFVSRRLTLKNTGDIATKFHWDTEKLAPYFSISPADGTLMPTVDAVFKLTFEPHAVLQEIKVENVACTVQGAEQPIMLSLLGQCIARPAATEQINFKTAVRTTTSKTITLSNKTTSTWIPQPQMDH